MRRIDMEHYRKCSFSIKVERLFKKQAKEYEILIPMYNLFAVQSWTKGLGHKIFISSKLLWLCLRNTSIKISMSIRNIFCLLVKKSDLLFLRLFHSCKANVRISWFFIKLSDKKLWLLRKTLYIYLIISYFYKAFFLSLFQLIALK